MLFNSL